MSIWGNTLVDNKPVVNWKAILNGVRYIGQLLNERNEFKTYSEIATLSMRAINFVEYHILLYPFRFIGKEV